LYSQVKEVDMELAAPAIWLRDNCSCGRCRHANGQKLHGITDLAADLRVSAITETGEEIRIRFDGDEHEAVFDRDWLSTWWAEPEDGDGRTEDAKRTWSAADLATVPDCDWSAYRAGPAARLAALESVLSTGFVMLHGVPADDGAVLDVAETFGFVRVTNYGDLFDVRVEADPTNLAFTALPISPHTDNPYRDPVPTLQLLHCLSNAARGGDSGLVDGFRAAALLRAEQPAAFDVLTRTEVTFAFSAPDAELRARRPMIGLDTQGRIREVRFNNRSLQPMRGERVAEFYPAYRAFAEILNRPELRLVLRLAPGDCLVFDNTRLLHARTAFDAVGERHLQGCYADLDGLASTVAVLRRELA
jgi:gamma-butyrobetaine dioxygenase